MQTICKLEDSYGIHEMINEEKVNEKIGEMFVGPLWKKIGKLPIEIFYKHTGLPIPLTSICW